FKRVASGKMPPPGEMPRPTADDVALLKRWIDAGAQSATPAGTRPLLAESAVLDTILADLEKTERRSRRFVRYFSLVPMANARAVMINTATRMPLVRADWFVATASRAPLYYDLLQMPTNLAELERQLRVDASQNILQERVARTGFIGSGISRNNRVLERHDAMNGA